MLALDRCLILPNLPQLFRFSDLWEGRICSGSFLCLYLQSVFLDFEGSKENYVYRTAERVCTNCENIHLNFLVLLKN